MRIYIAIHKSKAEIITATNLNRIAQAINKSGNTLRQYKSKKGMPFKIGLYTIHESELIKGNQRGNNLTG